ncbi:MAG TPA: Sua5/YciO/YrdC/YwlC family protein [Candidatus Thermoplasmatota archaeon]|nr:Sua5/YciO/YrdC/YwlC family protein [Candidatus Thermoplasmatota archaeon]
MEILSVEHPDAIARAMSALDSGELVIVPGDLRYFVVADALDDSAIERLFDATQRPADRPLIALLSGYGDLHHVGYGGSGARELAQTHWPGPTVLSVKARPWMPEGVTAGHDELRIMAPAQPATNALARAFGPLAAGSARIQGQRDSLDAKSAAERLGASVALVLDAGALPGGEEAYVVGPEG